MLQQLGLIQCQGTGWDRESLLKHQFTGPTVKFHCPCPSGPLRLSGSLWLPSCPWGTDTCMLPRLPDLSCHYFHPGALPPRWWSWEVWQLPCFCQTYRYFHVSLPWPGEIYLQSECNLFSCFFFFKPPCFCLLLQGFLKTKSRNQCVFVAFCSAIISPEVRREEFATCLKEKNIKIK